METSERIMKVKADLQKISPLALPQYLADCEFYDMQDTQKVLDEALKEFEDEGGVAGGLADVILSGTVNASALVLLKKFDKNTYKKAVKGKVNFGGLFQQIKNFTYPEEILDSSSNDIIRNSMQDQLQRSESGLSQKYKDGKLNYNSKIRAKEWDNEQKKAEYKEKYLKNNDEDVIGQKVYKNREDAVKNGAQGKDAATTDHVVPLAQIHAEHCAFARRYLGQKTANQIVNSDENYQILNQSSNSSKNDKSVDKWTDDLKKRLKKKPDDENRKRKEKAIENKEKLKKKEEKAKKHIRNEMLKEGSNTVLIEQVGKIIETMIGPLAFEIKDSIKNGITYGFSSNNTLECIFERIWRALKYVASQLPTLIGNLIGDIAQMLTAFFAEACKMIRDFFGKYIEIAMNGISIIIEAVKVLTKPGMSSAQKGDAICKLIIAFATGVLGNSLINIILDTPWLQAVPDFFKDLISITLSAVISAVVTHFFNKLDIFNIKREIRIQRVKEIFNLRIQQLKKNTANFEIVVTEKLKEQRIKIETIKANISESISCGDFEALNNSIDQVADVFNVSIPYSNTKEFVEYIRANSKIKIA